MKKYEHLKNKAIEFRKKGYTIDEICLRLNKSKSTVYGWIKDIPIRFSGQSRNQGRTDAQIKAQKKASEANKLKHQLLRDNAYNSAYKQADSLLQNAIFRDFINIYLGEGFRKTRHVVSVANSNPSIIKLSQLIISQNSKKDLFFNLQYHEDQNIDELKKFWALQLNINKESIKVLRKSNSNKLSGRNWASKYGVLTVGVYDTFLRSKIQAWMDYVQEDWNNYYQKSFEPNEKVDSNTLLSEISIPSVKNQTKLKKRPTRFELIELILTKPFTQIGKEFGVSDNAVRKWCKSETLPYRKKEIEENRKGKSYIGIYIPLYENIPY